jgi:integrase
MAKHNAANERIKRDYFHYLREAKGRGDASVDAAAKALSRFEESNGYKEFKKFHIEQAVAFKGKLDKQIAARTGERLSRATVNSTLMALRDFFIWLADKPGYKSRIRYSDADYFKLSDKDVRIATARRDKPVPTLEQVHHVIATMPHGTAIEKRDRALVAFTLLTGARDGALASLKLKHVDLSAGRLDQDARDVKTKFSKTFSTWFFPVGGEALAIVTDWISHLRGPLLRGDSDALFPSTKRGIGADGGFIAVGLERFGWSTSEPVRRIFRNAFEGAGLPYFPPHSLRHMLARFGEVKCQTPEQFKAWSQNLGHGDVLTTFTSYGTVPAHRQGEVIRALGVPKPSGGIDPAYVAKVMAAMGQVERGAG